MRAVADNVPELQGAALGRANAALARRGKGGPLDRAAARAELDALLARATELSA
jgi:beta-N-acetylhexosaminidase